MSYYWDIDTSGTSISLSVLLSNAPSGLTNNYDYSGVRNYSSWISYSGTLFSNLSQTQYNYINLYYTEKDEPSTFICEAYAGEGIDYAYPSVGEVQEGGSCTFRCTPSRGYVFSHWYGNDGYNYNPTFTKSNIYSNQYWTAYGEIAVSISTGTADANSATIYVSGNSSYPYVRLAYRKTSESGGTYTNWHYIPSSGSITVSGLESGTTYVFRLYFNSSADGTTQIMSNYINLTTTMPTTYELDVYDVYGGTTHYRDSYDLEAGYSFNASVYASPPYGYEYDHAESPRGTRVTSVTMNADRALYLFYTAIEPTTPSATITVTGRTENSLTVRANITNSLTYSDAWYLCISTTPSFSSYQSARGSGSSVTNTFTGLSPNTTYYFKVVNVYNEQQAWQSGYATGTTRRAAFAWDYNDNLDNRRPTANEWTRLVSFIEAVAGVTVSAAAKATIYVGGTLSHILFNELAQDVSLAQTVSKGTRIFKSVLNALKDKANTLR